MTIHLPSSQVLSKGTRGLSKKKALIVIAVIGLGISLVLKENKMLAQTTSRGKAQIRHAMSPGKDVPTHEDCRALRGSSGTWVQDWNYSNRSDYPNHGSYGSFHLAQQNFTPTPEQPFRLATSWRWQDDSCPISEISKDAFCAVCYELGVTRVLVVGDSFSMMFKHSLLSLLGSPPSKGQTSFNGCLRPNTIVCGGDRSFSITIWWFRRSPVADMVALANNGQKLEQYDFVEKNPNRTVVIANTGAWLQTMDDFRVGFDSLIQWIDSFNPAKVVAIYRPTIPGHWPCAPIGEIEDVKSFNWINPVRVAPFTDYQEYKANKTRMYHWDNFESYNAYAQEKLANRTADKAHIQWLNVFNSSVLRRDGHIGFGDCSHYYMPGPVDWWVHFFFSALLDRSKLELAQNHSARDNV